jgi:SAM-dependent methyltransferase
VPRDIESRLNPNPSAANYLLLRCLAAQLRKVVGDLDGQRLEIVDVGCGNRPYEELLRPVTASYVGVDWTQRPGVDVVAPAEDLPFEDDSFDLLLSTQVLEHVEDPARVVAEAGRVLRPGGIALVSTHGVVNYHPNPDDYWRWTHAGLARLLQQHGGFGDVEVHHNGGTASALTYLAFRQIEAIAATVGAGGVQRPVTLVANVLAWRADRLYARMYPGRPPDICANYLAVARRPEA